MRRGDDTPAEAARLLRPEVRHVGLRIQQALSDDGEAAQPRSGGRRHRVGEPDWRAWHRVHVPREGRGQGRHLGNLLPCNRGDGRRIIDGPSALFHHRQERIAICASLPAPQQLARQEPLPLRQLQHDQHRRGLPIPHRPRPVTAHLRRLVHHAGADGPPPRPRGGTAVCGGESQKA